ncbi:MAG: IspD/TarI family cytidylyltransferase [Acidimicrobiales bacterium]
MNVVAREVNAWGIVVAGGSGARYGGLKQLAELGGRRVLDHSLSALRTVCTGVVVVVPPDRVDEVVVDDADAVVGGGDTRSASVRSGLAAIGPDASHVLVHDAARPLASPALCRRVVDALRLGADAAIPVVEVTDSLRTVDGKPVDRAGFVAVQTPQGFDVEVLREAHRSGEEASDDATLVDRLGRSVAHVEGDPTNLKITEPHDLRLAEELLDGR